MTIYWSHIHSVVFRLRFDACKQHTCMSKQYTVWNIFYKIILKLLFSLFRFIFCDVCVLKMHCLHFVVTSEDQKHRFLASL